MVDEMFVQRRTDAALLLSHFLFSLFAFLSASLAVKRVRKSRELQSSGGELAQKTRLTKTLSVCCFVQLFLRIRFSFVTLFRGAFFCAFAGRSEYL